MQGKGEQGPEGQASAWHPGAIVDPVWTDDREAWYQGLVTLPRAALALLLILFTAAHGEPGLLAAGIVAALLVGTSVVSWVAVNWPGGPFVAPARAGRWSVAADVLTCLVAFGVSLPSSQAVATMVFPLLALVLALRYGRSGVAAGAAATLLAVGGRAAERSVLLHQPVGWAEILLTLVASSAGIAVALALRRERRAWETALVEQRRLAEALRLTLLDILDRPEPEPAVELVDHDVEELVEVACQFPELAPDLGRRIAAVARDPGVTHGLSRRELEVLDLMVSGASDREISRRLFIEVGTVRVHVSHIVRKLGLSDRQSVVALIRRHPAWRRRRPADPRFPGARQSHAI